MSVRSPLPPDTLVVAARDQVSCDLGAEAAILQLETGVYYTLDAVGSRVWALLQQPTRINQIRDTLLAEYDVAADRLAPDLTALLDDLAAEGLIEFHHAPAP